MSSNMNGNMFNRAAQRLPLTPQERSLLALLWHFILATLANSILAAAQAIFLYSTQHTLVNYNWWPFLILQFWNFVIAILVGVRKYVTATADKTYAPVAVSVLDIALPVIQKQQDIAQQNTQKIATPQVSQATVAPLENPVDTNASIAALEAVK